MKTHVCACTYSLTSLKFENSATAVAVDVAVAVASVVHTTLSIVVSRWRLTTLGLAVSSRCSLLPWALLKPLRKFVAGELTRLHNLSRSAFLLDNYLCCLINVNPYVRMCVCVAKCRLCVCLPTAFAIVVVVIYLYWNIETTFVCFKIWKPLEVFEVK